MTSPTRARSFGWLFWCLALVGLVADQASKFSVNAWLDEGQNHIEVGGLEHRGFNIVPRVFSLVRQERLNKGALFGFGNTEDTGDIANRIFAGVSAAAAIAIIFWSFRPSVSRSWVLSIALGLILAGAIGNLIDRVALGGVRDFIWVYYQGADGNLVRLDLPVFETANFPVFNIADSCLCVGAAILLLQTFFVKPATAAKAEPESKAVATADQAK